ncbi:DUF2804 domain-containing protein [Acinetobacter gerneri]|uniref:DUF2804 domain-containing protein n=1 Tax=Acinetobacter gerneri TaxID=202952 RepID=A0AAW8JGC5_9GAMM|nr:DUF2804 domain-containing protein [Acinetobacter gerneri]MDQ9009932.1 DUF2804 domain-containing protein [Acinetobacter gerneri]MDQ9014148.1 DUF2804 domain-containing protein [Acinetobacter gerneri]MDQ9025210.1 DUF2804 domain-containing protein [Acinetobacter gerneri]MDQ9050753.1 DUF2804 domain-containing protein [Acinetobacter gerneri]MDQ9060214.1 DUF2804 domain-containing protein [Acinetobacter gerneri]
MDLIQYNGQPRYGRFEHIPTSINVEKYIYQTPYGKVLTGWRKRLKYKKFKFCSIQHGDFSIGVAIADISWAGHGFIYIYDHATQQVLEWNANTFMGHNTVVDEQPLFNQSHFEKSPFHIEMQHANGVRYIRVTKHGEEKLKARIFCAGTQPLSLCSPNGINGWTYTQKKTTLAVEGFFVDKQKNKIDFNEKTLASLDDTCGFLRPETAWFWLSCNFWDAEGNRIGLNLASGVNESFGNENCLWFNGELYPVADVLFEKHDEQHWVIRSLDDRLHLMVETGWRRFENLNLRLVGSQFSQWQAKVSGTIQNEQGEKIQLNREYALLEQHYAKW